MLHQAVSDGWGGPAPQHDVATENERVVDLELPRRVVPLTWVSWIGRVRSGQLERRMLCLSAECEEINSCGSDLEPYGCGAELGQA